MPPSGLRCSGSGRGGPSPTSRSALRPASSARPRTRANGTRCGWRLAPASPPLLTRTPSTLDAPDGEGAATSYAVEEGRPRERPRGLVRRRTDDDATFDEAFTRNLRREPTEYLRLVGLGHNEVDHVEITAADAARFTEDATRRPGPPRPSHER